MQSKEIKNHKNRQTLKTPILLPLFATHLISASLEFLQVVLKQTRTASLVDYCRYEVSGQSYYIDMIMPDHTDHRIQILEESTIPNQSFAGVSTGRRSLKGL
jgi:hypothetical protein